MKFFIAFAAIVAVAMAVDSDKDAVVRSANVDITPLGGYIYNHETSNGISAQEQGVLKTVPDFETGKPKEVVAVTGQFSYTGDDGQLYEVKYIADENGFQATAPHLPVAPVA